MASFLPPNILLMFTAREPLEFKAPVPKPQLSNYSGLAAFKSSFSSDPPPPPETKIASRDQIKKQTADQRAQQNTEKNQKLHKQWDPHSNTKSTGDPYKTLFVSRISYKTSESKLKNEFSNYGPIKKIRLVTDSVSGKPKGYAFIEFEKERDMKVAYKQADGQKIDDRRVLVDIERGRVIKNWKPRKYGGGLGNTRAGGVDVNQTFSGREMSEQREAERKREEQEKLNQKRGGSSSGSGGSSGPDRNNSGGNYRDRKPYDRPRGYDRRDDGRRGGDDRRDDGRRGGDDRRGDRRDDRDRDRDRERGGDRERGSDRDRDRGGDRERGGDRYRSSGGDGYRDRERRDDRGDDRHRGGDGHRDRERRDDRGDGGRSSRGDDRSGDYRKREDSNNNFNNGGGMPMNMGAGSMGMNNNNFNGNGNMVGVGRERERDRENY